MLLVFFKFYKAPQQCLNFFPDPHEQGSFLPIFFPLLICSTIDCLVAICDHSPLQAEQCALLTHYNGRCDILSGEISELKPFQEDLELYGLNVQIL